MTVELIGRAELQDANIDATMKFLEMCKKENLRPLLHVPLRRNFSRTAKSAKPLSNALNRLAVSAFCLSAVLAGFFVFLHFQVKEYIADRKQK